MRQKPNLRLKDIKELSQIWYEHQFLEKEPVAVQEKFYTLIERIFENAKSEMAETCGQDVTSSLSQMRNRQLLAERLIQMLQYNHDLIVLFEKQCLELVRENSRSSFSP